MFFKIVSFCQSDIKAKGPVNVKTLNGDILTGNAIKKVYKIRKIYPVVHDTLKVQKSAEKGITLSLEDSNILVIGTKGEDIYGIAFGLPEKEYDSCYSTISFGVTFNDSQGKIYINGIRYQYRSFQTPAITLQAPLKIYCKKLPTSIFVGNMNWDNFQFKNIELFTKLGSLQSNN